MEGPSPSVGLCPPCPFSSHSCVAPFKAPYSLSLGDTMPGAFLSGARENSGAGRVAGTSEPVPSGSDWDTGAPR